MHREEVINALYKFRHVNKYRSFHEAMPYEFVATDEEREIITSILNHCCMTLITILTNDQETKKSSFTAALKKTLMNCMKQISKAPVSAENKEFGYILGYFLADKVGTDIRRVSEKKPWGYWKISGNEMIAPAPRTLGINTKK